MSNDLLDFFSSTGFKPRALSMLSKYAAIELKPCALTLTSVPHDLWWHFELYSSPWHTWNMQLWLVVEGEFAKQNKTLYSFSWELLIFIC